MTIGAPPRALEAVLDAPAGAAAGTVVCHPHPQYGGSMDVPLVVAVAGALVRAGRATLRFNFGGVGRSQGRYSGGPRELADVRTARAALSARLPAAAPIAIVGYSFGSWVGTRAAAEGGVERVVAVAPPLDLLDFAFLAGVACPVTIVVGDQDQYCAPDAAERVAAAAAGRIRVERIAGADHFLAGREAEVAARCVDALVAPAQG